MFDKLLEFVVNSVRQEEKVKQDKFEELRSRDISIPRDKADFWAEKRAGDLVEPSKKRALRHRESEKEYTTKLEEAEKELKEKGISVEVYDSVSQTYQSYGNIVSGAFTNVPPSQQNFQPRVDQKLMDAVKNAKSKMLEHREWAKTYEKYARAFALNPDFMVKLSVEDIHYFRLGD